MLDREQCTDCQVCIDACPYGAIRVAPDGRVIKCDLCGGNPQCVTMCETGAIKYMPRQPQKMTWARIGTRSFLSEAEILEE